MKYLPTLLILIAMVGLMAGAGDRGWRATRSILLVIGAFLVFAALFALVVKRTI